MPDTIPDTLPTILPTPAATLNARRLLIAYIPQGGTQKNFLGLNLKYDGKPETLEHESCDPVTLTKYVDRIITTKRARAVKFDVDEITDEVIAIINAGIITGVFKFWVQDPSDAENTVAILSNEFAGTIMLEGEFELEDASFSKPTFIIKGHEEILLSRNASVGS